MWDTSVEEGNGLDRDEGENTVDSKDPGSERAKAKGPDTDSLKPKEDSAKQPDPKKTLTGSRLDLKKSEALFLDRQWLAGKSQEELIEFIFQLFLELKARIDLETRTIASPTAPSFFSSVSTVKVKEYIRRPAGSTKKPEEVADVTWRLILTGLRADHRDKPIGLEIFGDVIIGRTTVEGTPIDLDLTNYDGDNLGVSRRHAVLRPRTDRLDLIDLGSTNGTLCNAVKLRAGVPQELSDGDTLSFAGLHFNLRIVERPPKAI
jgi:hypothetical protein